MNKEPSNHQNQVISYITLRLLIGTAGLSLPFLLFIGKLIYSGSTVLEFSISDYYNKGTAGDILVGVLFALGFFLFSYRGYERIDSISGKLGCVFSLGVALFPTTSTVPLVHYAHFIFAFLLFSVFIFFSIYLFRKSDPLKKPTPQKTKRNQVYLVCGIIMIVCIAGIALCEFVFQKASEAYHLVFWGESVALVSFGVSWIVKSERLVMGDPK
jgi:hypothetical protein